MPNDERILETMPTGTLGLIPTASCMELGSEKETMHLFCSYIDNRSWCSSNYLKHTR